MKDEVFTKELEFIQSVISRMAQNSFYIKGWAVSLVAIVIALSGEDILTHSKNEVLFILLAFVVFAFWYLDSYYLKIERLYRKHYEWVIRNRLSEERLPFDLNVGKYIQQVPGVFSTMWSISLIPFYCIPFFILIGLFIVAIVK